MLDRETARRIAVESVGAGMRTAWADAQGGRTYASLSDADRTIVADLGSRLAFRSALVRAVPAQAHEEAALAWRFCFARAYRLHLADLSAHPDPGPSEPRREQDTQQLVSACLEALDAIVRARGT
jgi:hypothetical protein